MGQTEILLAIDLALLADALGLGGLRRGLLVDMAADLDAGIQLRVALHFQLQFEVRVILLGGEKGVLGAVGRLADDAAILDAIRGEAALGFKFLDLLAVEERNPLAIGSGGG